MTIAHNDSLRQIVANATMPTITIAPDLLSVLNRILDQNERVLEQNRQILAILEPPRLLGQLKVDDEDNS